MSIATQITALQTDKTAIRNAILNKGGTSASGNGFDDFATDIATIPTGVTPTGTISITSNGTHDVTNYASASVNVSGGGTDYLQYAKAVSFFGANLTGVSDITLNLPRATDISGLFYETSYLPNITINLGSTNRSINMASAFFKLSHAQQANEYIKITGDLSGVTSYAGTFSRDYDIPIIDADIDFTSATNVTNIFYASNTITSIRFVPNSLSISMNVTGIGALDDASTVSLANCLQEGVTSKTLTVPTASVYAKFSTMTGTVSLDSTSTYHIFTEDASGSTTLADFVTNTKGWTLAS